jgi:hypothetical protein
VILLFGTRGKVKTVGHFTMRCPLCGVTCAQALRDARRHFTLFFVPVFPVSHTAALVCSSCGQGRKIDKATAAQMTEYLAGHVVGSGATGYGAAPPPAVAWSPPPAFAPPAIPPPAIPPPAIPAGMPLSLPPAGGAARPEAPPL